VFGENLTTEGVDVNGALIGERWRVGPTLVLEAAGPRIPCGTFQGWLAQAGWIKRFALTGRPGTFFRVIEPGEIQAGDEIEMVHRLDHNVTVALTFRALLVDPDPEANTPDRYRTVAWHWSIPGSASIRSPSSEY
jgi:MOSC domain-containing protein YiiM